MNRLTLLFAVFFILTGTASIYAQATSGDEGSAISEKRIGVEISDEAAVILDGQRITLSEAIKKALELNPDIYIAKYDAAMADTGQMNFNAKYSPVLNAGGGVSSDTNPEFFYSNYIFFQYQIHRSHLIFLMY